MSFPTTPRINSPLLNKFHDKTVRIIGKVESQDGDLVSFDANGPLKVKADGTTEYTVGKFYEVVGKVTTDDELISYSCTDFGDNIGE